MIDCVIPCPCPVSMDSLSTMHLSILCTFYLTIFFTSNYSPSSFNIILLCHYYFILYIIIHLLLFSILFPPFHPQIMMFSCHQSTKPITAYTSFYSPQQVPSVLASCSLTQSIYFCFCPRYTTNLIVYHIEESTI